MTRLPPRLALTALLAALLPGCTLGGANTTGSSDSAGYECEDPNSYLEGDACYCDPGYDFCNNDPDDRSCCPAADPTTSPGPTTAPNPTTAPPTTEGPSTDTSNTTGTTGAIDTTTGVTATTTEGTTGTTTEGTTTGGTTTGGEETCMGAQPPPEECVSGQFWCTMPEVCGPEGSELYRCEQGVWTLEPNLAGDSCGFDGYDFAYGCVDDGDSVLFICGDGPGDACEPEDPSACANDQFLEQCVLGKLTHYDCFVQCTEIGDDMGALYDHGFCGEADDERVCLCCDMDDPNCPI